MGREEGKERFRLRRGARFAESLGDTRATQAGDQDEAWLSGLRTESAGRTPAVPGDEVSPTRPQQHPSERAEHISPARGDASAASATLSGMLVSLTEVLGGFDRSLSKLDEALTAARTASAVATGLIDEIQVAIVDAVVTGFGDGRPSPSNESDIAVIDQLTERLLRLEQAVTPAPDKEGPT